MERAHQKNLEEILDQIKGLYDENRVEQALEVIRDSAHMDSRDENSLGKLADFLVGAGEFASARKVLLKLVLIAPTLENNYQLARCCHLSGWTDHATIILDRIQEFEKEIPAKIHKLHGDILMARQDWDGALLKYSKANKLDSDDSEILASIAKCSRQLGIHPDSNQGKEFLTKSLDFEPDFTETKEPLNQAENPLGQKENSFHKEVENKCERFSFWQGQEYDTDCGIPCEQIPEDFISVVIPVCNHEALLKPQLESLLRQNLSRGLEILVVDYGSIENEESVVHFFDGHKFPVRYQKSGSKNKIDAYNAGAKGASGEYILFARPGETLREDAGVRFTKAIRSREGVKAVYSDWAQSFLPNDNFINPSIAQTYRYQAHENRFLLRFLLAAGPLLVDKSWLDELMYLTKSKSSPFHEFLLRTAIAGGEIVSIPEVLGLRYCASHDDIQSEIAELNELTESYINDFPIERIYDIDPENQDEVANVWVALGNWMLDDYRCPAGKYASDEMDLAVLCFKRALDHSPAHESAIQNLAMTSTALGQQDDILSYVDRLHLTKKKHLISSVKKYRRNFSKVEMGTASGGGEYRDKWTDKVVDSFHIADGWRQDNTQKCIATHQSDTQLTIPIRWVGTFFADINQSSVAIEWAQSLSSLQNVGMCHCGNQYSRPFVHGLPHTLRQRLYAMSERYDDLDKGIAIYHNVSEDTELLSNSDYHIGIANASSSSLCPAVVKIYNQFDEVWVANSFLKDIVIRSGVEKRKVERIPLSFDNHFFAPKNIDSSIPSQKTDFQFLAIVDDPKRCGLDLSVQAFLEQFNTNESVSLLVFPCGTSTERLENIKSIQATLSEYVSSSHSSRIKIIEDAILWNELPELINESDCVVLPYRFEAYGMEVVRAIGCGRPVISTNHGGVGELLESGNIELISHSPLHSSESTPAKNGWVEPSLEELKQSLINVVNDPDLFFKRAGAAAVGLTNLYGQIVVEKILENKLSQIEAKLANPTLEPISMQPEDYQIVDLEHANETSERPNNQDVFFEGEMVGQDTSARFNNQFLTHLDACHHINVSRLSQDSESMKSDQRLLIRNLSSQKFLKPSHGLRWVHMADWSFSRIPQDWVQRLENADDIWVTSEFQRRAYVDSGVDPSKLTLIPVGIDTDIFNPGAEPIKLNAKKVYRFLYIGKGEWGGGVDLLLNSFYESFKGKSNVELVLVDAGSGDGQTSLRGLADQFSAKPDAPSINYMIGDFTDAEFASLYTACDCFVSPHRCESYGMRVLEAMSCGLPVIVTGGGSTDDFVGDNVGYRVPAYRRRVGNNDTHPKLAGPGFYLEADISALGAEMTHVLYHPQQAAEVGKNASKWILSSRRWDASIKIASERIHLLSKKFAIGESKSGDRDGAWQSLENLTEKGPAQKAWTTMCSAIKNKPFNPDACRGLLNLSIKNNWNSTAQTIQKWMMKWLDTDATRIGSEAIETRSLENSKPNWASLPSIISEENQPPKLTVAVEVSSFSEETRKMLQPFSTMAHQIILCGHGAGPDPLLLDDIEAEWTSVDTSCSIQDRRNNIVDQSSGDWILFLEEGESFDESNLNSLYGAMTTPKVIACSFPKITILGEGKKSREFALRLFRNAPGLIFTGDIYEHLSCDWHDVCSRWNLSITHEPIILSSQKISYQQFTVQRRSIKEELKSLVAENPLDLRLRFNLAEELSVFDLTDEAQHQYLKIIQILAQKQSDICYAPVLENTFTSLAELLLKKEQFNQIVDLFDEDLIRIHGLTSSMHHLKAKSFIGLNETDKATVEFLKAQEKKHIHSHVMTCEEIGEGSLEDKTRDLINNTDSSVISNTWDRGTQSGRSTVSIDDDERPSEEDFVPLSM